MDNTIRKYYTQREEMQLIKIAINYPDRIIKEKSDDLLNDIVCWISYFPSVKVDFNTVWRNKSENRSWMFWIHSLAIIEVALKGYEIFNNEEYINKCEEVILLWIEKNMYESDNEFAWHDHSTAIRLLIICSFFELWKKEHWKDDVACKLFLCVEKHLKLLSENSFYMEKHNHGIDQDISLFIAAKVFSHINGSEDYKKLAYTRLKKQLSSLFHEDGSYVEHSPHYSLILTDRLIQFQNFIHLYETGYDFEFLDDIINGQLEFMINIFHPNLEIGYIGDSDNRVAKFDKWQIYNFRLRQIYDYIISNGETGRRPEYLDKVYQYGGYSIMRNKWEYDSETVQLIFYSSFHSRVHKHHDDLSVSIFGLGIPLIMDGGKYNYEYEDLYRKYIISNRAHNTITIDNMNTDIKRQNIGNSGLISYYYGEDICITTGAHCLYEGITHIRTVVFLKPNEILIIDKIDGFKEHIIEQYFHFNPACQCNLKNNKVYIKVNDKEFYLKQMLNNNITMHLSKGSDNPINGYRAMSYSNLVPSFYLNTSAMGESAEFVTYINLGSTENIKSFVYKEDCYTFKWKKREICIDLSRYDQYVTINGRQIDQNIIINDKLKNSIEMNNDKSRKELLRAVFWDNTGNQIIQTSNSIFRLGEFINVTINIKNCDKFKIAWYIYFKDQLIIKTNYKYEGKFSFIPEYLGSYKIKAFIKHESGCKISTFININVENK